MSPVLIRFKKQTNKKNENQDEILCKEHVIGHKGHVPVTLFYQIRELSTFGEKHTKCVVIYHVMILLYFTIQYDFIAN